MVVLRRSRLQQQHCDSVNIALWYRRGGYRHMTAHYLQILCKYNEIQIMSVEEERPRSNNHNLILSSDIKEAPSISHV